MPTERSVEPLSSYAPGAVSLVDALRLRATEQHDAEAYRFLPDGETAGEGLSYGELDRAARALAVTLRDGGVRTGDRVLLVHPPGPDFFVGFFGALYANAIAVPCYPPDPTRLDRTLPRFANMASDVEPSLALTTSAMVPLLESLGDHAPELKTLRWEAGDTLDPGQSERWDGPEPAGGSLALIQYTSGSTASPKGVMITHSNILRNLSLIHEGVFRTPEDRGLFWLPPYHDMGLLNVLYAIVVGFPLVGFSPVHFVQRPSRWLEAISRHSVTYSGAPNFAYDLCVRKVTPDQKRDLDLSSWAVAFTGAEPIRGDTLRQFGGAFGPCGFSTSSFLPCYGLAEVTVALSGGRAGAGPRYDRVSRQALAEAGVAVTPDGSEDARELVGVGDAKSAHRILIVDPVRRVLLPEGTVGEIWFSGPSVAAGYWRRDAESEEVFGGRLADGSGPYLRTGDLGYLRQDELYVTGRSKDLLIIRGLNYYPQDIERTVEDIEGVRPGCSAAFAIPDRTEEGLAIVAEVETDDENDLVTIMASIHHTVARDHGVEPGAISLIEPRTLAKTSSGKVQRAACREAFETGALRVVHAWTGGLDASIPAVDHGGGREASAGEIRGWLIERAAALLGVEASGLSADAQIDDIGLDSLNRVELTEDVSVWLDLDLSLSATWESFSTIAEMADFLASDDAKRGPRATTEARSTASAAITPDAERFYTELTKEEDRERTNVHYELPARFFEVLTGGHWHAYSGNLWDGIEDADPGDQEHQTRAQEAKLDTAAALLELEPGRRLLDVGSGWGGPLIYLSKRYGVRGHGISLSETQTEYARAWAKREGVDCEFEVCHWDDFVPAHAFDAIYTDEIVVHFFRLEEFFRRAIGMLRSGGVLVNKELHFTHPSYGDRLDRMSAFVNALYGGTGNYRALSEELTLANRAGFAVEDHLRFRQSNYLNTARAWYHNLSSASSEMVSLVGEETYSRYRKYVTWVMLGPGGLARGVDKMHLDVVKYRKVDELITPQNAR